MGASHVGAARACLRSVAQVFLFADDPQIRDVRYREVYAHTPPCRLRLWQLDGDSE
jgi:hypothetical protein